MCKSIARRILCTIMLSLFMTLIPITDLLAEPVGYASLNGGTTGGQGGLTAYAGTGTQIHEALCSRDSKDTPIIIYVEGTITPANTYDVDGDSCNVTDGVIEIKEVSNVSIIGIGNGALFDEVGIHIRNSSNIILQNLHIRDVKKSNGTTSNGGDAIGMEANVSNVWVDHCTLEAFGGEAEGYDALFDMKNNTKYVTLSYCILKNSGRGGLVGSSDSDDKNNYITYHHNLYQNIDSRTPLLRFATAHSFNNHFNGINSSGMNPRIGGRIKAENNYVQNARNPLGTFYTDEMGYWDVSGNIWDNVTWEASSDEVPAGPDPVSTTSITIPYAYSLDDASCIPQIIAQTAGANKGLLVSDGSCQDTSDSSSNDNSSNTSGSGSSSSSSNSVNMDELGVNLALNAGADGTSKGDHTSYGNVTDGDLSTYWSPGSTSYERISVKNFGGGPFNTVIIRELNNATTSWRLVNNDSGEELAAGGSLGSEAVISGFGTVSMDKINLMIDSADTVPQIAEFELYNGTISSSSEDSDSSENEESENENVVNTLTIQENESGYCGVDGSVDSNHEGFTGTGFSNTDNTDGNGMDWAVNGDSGSYTLRWRYANGSSTNRTCVLTVNEARVSTEDFYSTGSWSTWATTSVTLDLSGGYKKLRLAANQSSGLANIDYIEITGPNVSTASCDGSNASSETSSPTVSIASITLEEDAKGFCSVDGAVENEHNGYTGTGYANTDNAEGNGVEYRISVPSGGTYTMDVRYAATSTRSADIVVNGSVAGSLGLSSTGAWDLWAVESTDVYLNGGVNVVTLTATNSSGLPNVDSLTIKGNSPEAEDCSSGIDSSPDLSDSVSVGGDCEDLINDPGINWRESDFQTDQEIVKCLSESLGNPVGFGENATGGYSPGGGSNLVVISANSSPSPEQALLEAISSTAYNWIVFDKDNPPSTIAMYRLFCSDSDVLGALGNASQSQCLDHETWCSANGIAGSDCADEFFNNRLNDDGLPIRNPMIDSNTTIDGRGVDTKILFSGFKIGADSGGASTHVSQNVIITNLYFEGAGHVEDHGLDPDMVRSTGESHDIWIHQNTFDYTGDSAFDVKVGAYDITISFNLVKDVLRSTLHGSSDSRTINEQIKTTIHNNAFVTTDARYEDLGNTMRRVPLMRRGQSHIFNNVFYGYRKDIMSVRVGGRVIFENNVFANNTNNAKGDDLDYWTSNLLDDALDDGDLRISGSYVWASDASCQLIGAPGDLNATYGNPQDMLSQYNATSKNTINANMFNAGSDLADYVFATAGKGGLAPYVSSHSPGYNSIISQRPSSCQETGL